MVLRLLSKPTYGVSRAMHATESTSRSAAQGAATSVFAATAPELAGQSGAYLADCAVASASAAGRDAELAERLWGVSEQIVAHA